uniref:EamA domain-containing protein n=1 Tax=Chromera velia CCMP2878 TaxID=1169474 RepID=A0A0G4HFF6_9ALVE|eukprot:Cvel_27024.t1-p1 / transcript=Cvel_27024.t1 / gene=Cvel_27024 / organism=Chromera_velia_CCMP2878 / gene_product=Uncharacterized membrane protein YMR253C, putative / transcript_product=Uncharacterized membrane protein YMR253C, putative / location=Cvel_scaffold3305:12776-14719(+) / protein_length=364 / sequence_SO=supercontig / SO=protein_coding / is_pseudo=false
MRVKVRQPPGARRWSLVVGVFGATAMISFFVGLTQLPLGDAVAVYSTTPLFAAVVARVWLGERMHWLSWIAGLVTVLGVIVIASPRFLSPVLETIGLPPSDLDKGDKAVVPRMGGVGFVLFASAMASIALTTIRKLKNASPSTPVLAMSTCTVFVSLVVMVGWDQMRPSWEDLRRVPLLEGWGSALAAGLCSGGAQVLMSLALQLEKAGPATFAMTLDTVFAFIFQVTILGTPLGLGSVVGSVMTLGAVFLLVAVKLWSSSGASRGEESERKKRKRKESRNQSGRGGTLGTFSVSGRKEERVTEEEEEEEEGIVVAEEGEEMDSQGEEEEEEEGEQGTREQSDPLASESDDVIAIEQIERGTEE